MTVIFFISIIFSILLFLLSFFFCSSYFSTLFFNSAFLILFFLFDSIHFYFFHSACTTILSYFFSILHVLLSYIFSILHVLFCLISIFSFVFLTNSRLYTSQACSKRTFPLIVNYLFLLFFLVSTCVCASACLQISGLQSIHKQLQQEKKQKKEHVTQSNG